jgi:hypothetical protein
MQLGSKDYIMMLHNCSLDRIKKLLKEINVEIITVVTIILFIIFLLLDIMVPIFRLNNIGYAAVVITMCLLIAYELLFIKYILIQKVEHILQNIKIEPNNERYPYDIFENWSANASLFYLIILFIILMFFLIDVLEYFYGVKYFFSSWDEMNHCGLLLDIYNYILTYLINFLLAVIIWIIISLTFTIRDISTYEYSSLIMIEFLNYENRGYLGQLKNLISRIFTYYFICIGLAIASYFSPFSYLYYQSLMYIFLLLIGIILFVQNLNYLKKILINNKIKKLKLLNNIYSEDFDKFLYKNLDENELRKLLSKLKIAKSFYEVLTRKNRELFDFEIIAAILSILVSIITLVQKFFI